MSQIIAAIKAEIDHMGQTPKMQHLRTGDIRKLSAKLWQGVKGEPRDSLFAICDELLEQRDWLMGVIAYDFAYRARKQYDEGTFAVFERWLEAYVRGWGDCDDFCTHAFGALICQYVELAERVAAWTAREEFWMRRAAAVVLIPSIWNDLYSQTNPLHISDLLMMDEHDLVRKGYGWMLKILSVKVPDLVFDYLLQHKAVMPRVAYRYALEKMDADKRKILMR